MRPFRFRAAIVLDLRQKTDQEAQRALALAKAAVLTAETALADAEAAWTEALRRAAEAQASAQDETVLLWYRNWMVGRQQDVAHCRAVLDERRAVLQAATRTAMEARRALRVIERYRDRVWRTYQREALRAEQKDLDLLGTLQHAARHLVPGGRE